MGNTNENNQVILSGKVIKGFKFNHEFKGEKFYITQLSVLRLSGAEDLIPVVVSNRLIPTREDWAGRLVTVRGEFRSYNKWDGKKRRLILYVFAQSVDTLDEIEESKNKIILECYICKKPIYRKTPLGREIADLLVATHRAHGKSDYVPCICWGRNARWAQNLGVGARLEIEGRIQSREYQKKISEDQCETRTAYEVSASKIEEVEVF